MKRLRGERAVTQTSHLIFEHIVGRAPTIVWLCGYRSDMGGNKVQALKAWAQAQGVGFFCFDYSGHGASGGRFEDGTISLWLAQAQAMIAQHLQGACIIVGSSMGGWLALRLAEMPEIANQLQAMVLLAPAPDFTEDLIWQRLTPQQQAHAARVGYFEEQSDYSAQPNRFTMTFIEDGRTQCVLNRPYTAPCPVHILQGSADTDVPPAHAMKLMAHLGTANVQLTLIHDGDHRLSRPEDIAVLLRFVGHLAGA